ncbi:hypothetical protein MMC13_002809 [Lambiella insularis]|nr:hypothetical protein [Lambiella insularis]
MAFSFASAGNTGFGPTTGVSGSVQIQYGPDLEEISTEGLGFQSLAGESKVRLLPTPWPTESLPPPTASLLSIASSKGLLAAAGPESVVIASTDSVRDAFTGDNSSGSDVKSFTPQLTLQIGTRVSQVAFSADEKFLVISAEVGGGLKVYDVERITQGDVQSAFEMSTNGISLRALTPNPASETAEFFAIVTTNGQLMMANMKTRQLMNGRNGPVMKDGVSCVSWSTRGKQLVAGLGNGAGYQMTPEGEGKAEIPKPSAIEGEQHVSAISWLENHVFLMAHTPSIPSDGMAAPTSYTLVTRQPPAAFAFQKLPEVCGPFGLNRSPSFHFIQRLKDFPPAVQDILIVASTSSEDVGLFTRSKTALSSEMPAEKITNVFTTTTMANDSRRAQIPMTEDMTSSTTAIGMALDLSSKTRVPRPLPGEEMDESPGPLPALMILNNEGVLIAYWIVYADSIRQSTAYPGLVVAGLQQQQATGLGQPTSAPSTTSILPAAPAPVQSAFGKNSFGASGSPGAFASGFSKPAAPAFGASSIPGSSSGAFGTATGLRNQQSLWGTAGRNGPMGGSSVTFGQPAFGSATAITAPITQRAAFGAPGGIGNKASPWGTPATSASTATPSVFGQQSGMSNASTGGIFGSSSINTVTGTAASGGFASFAKGPGFAASSAAQGTGESVFGKSTPATSFTSAMDVGSSFGGTPSKPAEKPAGLFGSGGNFVLSSSWKNENPVKADTPKQSDGQFKSLFGNDFGKSLGDTAARSNASEIKEADMMSDKSNDHSLPDSPVSPAPPATTTPADTPAPPKFTTDPPRAGGFFGTQTQNTISPAAVQSSTPTQRPGPANVFPNQTEAKAPPVPSPAQTTTPRPPLFGTPPSATATQQVKSPLIKTEPVETPFGVHKSVPQAPLPPDSTSKTSYTPDTSSAVSSATSKSSADAPLPPDFLKPSSKKPSTSDDNFDSPLPPDFLPSKTKPKPSDDIADDEPPLPADADDGLDDDLDDEGSGVDVAQEISPSSDHNPISKMSHESSFGAQSERSPLDGLFTKIGRPQTQKIKPLFGEIGTTSVPRLPPPTKTQLSPRSPSPIRSAVPGDLLRPDAARSISAHAIPPRAGLNRKVTLGRPSQSNVPSNPSVSAEERHKAELARIAKQKAEKQAEEEQDLSDREDEKVREELATEVEPTTSLEPFIAHQDYTGNIDKPGIPGQIEKVYRDINSMIDTLGLNARSLEAFTKGHSEMNKDGGRDREDLESDADWVLVEIADLAAVENSIGSDLQQGRLRNVQDKIESCRELQKDLAKIRTRNAEIKRQVYARSDPDKIEALRAAPLSPEQSALRHDLRKDFTNFQKLLTEAEEGISMLRAKLTSVEGGNKGGSGQKVPTVEAVERTIMKMTGMVEKKSGDIDVLELQMRKLNVIGNIASREGSPFVTPPTSARKGQALMQTSSSSSSINGNGAFFTPRSGKSTLRDSMASSAGGMNRTARRKMSQVTDGEVKRYGEKVKKRREVGGLLKEALIKRGVRVRGLDDI